MERSTWPLIPPTDVRGHLVTELPLHDCHHLSCKVPAPHRVPQDGGQQHLGHVVLREVTALAKKTKVNQKQIKEWLESQDAYTLHKQVSYRFPRRKTIVSGPNQQWQAHLIDVSRLSRHNKGIKFLLTCIDVFSKKAWVVPLKDKSGISLVAAFESIHHHLPKTLQTDKGIEFLNHKFQQWLKDHKVHFFTTENEDIKASIVEHFNRTLKTKLWRYFTRHNTLTYTDILEYVVDVYNHTPHRSIGMAPNEHLQIKDGYGSNFMLTQCLIKKLPYALGTQSASVRQGVHSRRVIWLSGLKKSSPSWNGRVHNLPHLCWQITAAKS